MTLIDCLNWRHASKSMNRAPVPREALDRILESVRLTATSSGLQPFELQVVSSAALKAKIRPIAMGQRQIEECSHLIVFAAWDRFTTERVDFMFDLANDRRGGPNAGLAQRGHACAWLPP